MLNRIKISKLFRVGLIIFLFLLIKPIFGQSSDLKNKIQKYQSKLKQLQQQKNTLSSQIQYMDTQIYLTELTIKETEQKVTTIPISSMFATLN